MTVKKIRGLKRFFPSPVDKGTREEVLEIFAKECYSNQIFTGVMVLILQSLMMGLSLLSKGPWPDARQTMYFFLYMSLAAASVLFTAIIMFIHYKAPRQAALQTGVTGIFILLVCVWASGITILDQYNGPNLSVFSYVIMAIPILGILRPWQYIIVFGGAFIILNGSIFLLQDNPLFYRQPPDFFNNIINSLSACILAAGLSITMYFYRFNSHYKQFVINSQYEKINALNEQLANMVLTDPLTLLKNRRFLEEEMQRLQESDYQRPLTGMMLDIDFFKQYNDRYGHQAGDACLRNVAAVLQDFVKDRDAFVVRYGGEEFFVCMADCPDPEAEAELLRKAVEERCLERDDTPAGHVTVSIGVDVTEDLMEIGMDGFLRHCDHALYRAKNSGRNRVAKFENS